MVLPLLIGLAGLLGIGFVAISISSYVVNALALGGATVIALRGFQYSLMEDPLPVFDSENLQNLFYGALAALIGFISYKVLTAVLQLFGLTVAILVVVLLVAGLVFSFPVVFAALARFILSVLSILGIGGE